MKVVSIDFGGTIKKPMKLKFGTRAFTLLEELSGKPISELDMNSMHSLFVLITAGLRWQKHDLTVDSVYDMMDVWSEKIAEEEGCSFFDGMAKAMEEVSKLVSIAMGEDLPAPNEE